MSLVSLRYRELRMPRHESILPIYGLPVQQCDLLLCVEGGLSRNMPQVSVEIVTVGRRLSRMFVFGSVGSFRVNILAVAEFVFFVVYVW